MEWNKKIQKQFRCLLKQCKNFIWYTSVVGVKITITDVFNLRYVNSLAVYLIKLLNLAVLGTVLVSSV